MYNAGENQKLEEECIKQNLGIQFEYTSPGTPQQNGIVERACATLQGRVRAMMNGADFTEKKRGDMWAEAANTSTILDCIMVDDPKQKCSYFKFYGKEPKYAR